MADVSKIQLPDNTVVTVKDARIPGVDSAPRSGSGNVITSGGVYSALASPYIAEKLFDDTFASSSSYSVHCFLTFIPDDWSKIYTIRFRVKAWIPNVANSTAVSDVTLQLYHGVVKAYYIKNAIANTDYRPYYSLYYYGATDAGYGHDAPDIVGIYINSANCYSYTTKRIYKVQVINAEGCSFAFFDTDLTSSQAKAGFASSDYRSSATYNTYTAGLQETGDTNSTYSVISNDELRAGTATTGRTVSAARLAANYSITTDSNTGVKTLNIAGVTVTLADSIEPNPTVPSGTTPTDLTGIKVGESYYAISGSVSDVTVNGVSVVTGGVAVIPAIPSIEALSTAEIDTIWANAS